MSDVIDKEEEAEELVDENVEKYLMFDLGPESYGMRVLKVSEIIQVQEITPVPQMPDHVKGVINLRGRVVPVIDLRVKFGVGSGEITERTCNVVVEVESEDMSMALVGLTVDGVDEVVNIRVSQIEDKPDLGTVLKSEYIEGIVKLGMKVSTLLDIDKVVLEDRGKLSQAV